MTKQRKNGVAWVAAAALMVPAVAWAQAAGPQTAAGDVLQAPAQDRYVVGRALPPEIPGSPRVEMTLDQAIARALEKNLNIQRDRLAPQMQDYTLQAARANFRPTLQSSYSYNNQSQAGARTTEAARATTQTNSINATITQRLPWQGGQVSFNTQNSRAATDDPFSNNNPNIRTSMQFSYSQPLLAGRTIDNQRQSLRTGEINRRLADLQLENTIEDIKNLVRTRYWSLKQAIEAIEIQRRALEQSNRQLAESKIKVEVGTMAEIDLVQQESQIAQGEQNLLQTEITWRNAEISFKQVLVDSANDPFLQSTIVPVDQVQFSVTEVNIPEAVQQALAERIDLITARQNLEITQLNLEVSRNQTMPTLNLNTSYQATGAGGNRYSGGQGSGDITQRLSFADALSEVLRRETPTWQVSLNFNKPLGMSAQKANHLRSELQLEQQRTTLKSSELNVATAVQNAGLNVQNTYKQLLASQKTREAAERTLEAGLTRFQVGMITNFEVITLQNNLTSARNNELTATIRYINAVADFERIQKIQ